MGPKREPYGTPGSHVVLTEHREPTNLVNFGLVTLEFKKGKDVHPLVDQQFGYAAPLLRPCGDQY